MNFTIDLKYEPTKDSVLYYNGDRWLCIKKDIFLLETQKQINELKEKNEWLTKKLEDTIININEKLKEYHEVLKLLSKGE